MKWEQRCMYVGNDIFFMTELFIIIIFVIYIYMLYNNDIKLNINVLTLI